MEKHPEPHDKRESLFPFSLHLFLSGLWYNVHTLQILGLLETMHKGDNEPQSGSSGTQHSHFLLFNNWI